MPKREAATDLWTARMLDECRIGYDPQGSSVKEIGECLKSASKRGTGNAGWPEYVAVAGGFVVVVEDKAELARHILCAADGVLDMSHTAVVDYAVNGACHYALHIAQHSSFHKVFAVGVSGDERHHRITPLYVDDRGEYKILPDLESFVSFAEDNIGEYYARYVLGEVPDYEKTTEEILADAKELHEYLRTYGSVKDQDKPLVVSGLLLALDDESFTVDSLKGSSVNTDGELVCDAISRRLKSSDVGPDAKRDKLMSEFSMIRTSMRMNEVNDTLGKTPLRFYAEFLRDRVYANIKYRSSSEDFVGRFYGEFMSYSGGDGQSLGIILTPSHICDLCCQILDVGTGDTVLDPCCGTGGFLVAAMHCMLSQAGGDQVLRRDIKRRRLHGLEIQSNMFAIAATNMILRDDGNSNIRCEDFLKTPAAALRQKGAAVGMMNPPYSQGSKDDPSQYELSFVEHLLDSLADGARCAVVLPQSSMTGKTKEERAFKAGILGHHTLEGIITCNADTFYGVGVDPVIAVFTAHEPHRADKVAKFVDFRDDGYEVRAHVGLVEGNAAEDRRRHLLDVWFGREEAPSGFCVKSTVKATDEWLRSFYYFNDEIPAAADFDKTVGDYLAFEYSMIMQDRGYLFDGPGEHRRQPGCAPEPLSTQIWRPFVLEDVFSVESGVRLEIRNKSRGSTPFIGAVDNNNGVTGFVGNDNRSEDGNVLGVNYNGAPCIAFYHPYKCLFTDDVKRLHLKNYPDGEAVLMFFCPVFGKQRCKYGYGYKCNTRRMLRQKIMLPATPEGEPDYSYMERYMRRLIAVKHGQYLSYIEGRRCGGRNR